VRSLTGAEVAEDSVGLNQRPSPLFPSPRAGRGDIGFQEREAVFSRFRDSYVELFVIFLVSLFIRWWLLDKRWLDVDEGAHLMDAVLALDGKVPVIEYMSREPLYVYSIAGFLKLFGTDFILARFLPAACSLLVGFVVFLLAKTLFNDKVALLSSAIYWMLPLELFQSVKATTEPLVTLLTCLAFYAVVKFSQSSQRHWLVVAGVLSALGFYARNSAIVIPVAVFVFIVLFCEGRAREVARNFGFFMAGYGTIVLLVVAYYSRFTSLADLFFRLELNPLSFLPWSVEQLLSLRRPGSDAPFWPSDLFFKYVVQTTYLHSFLLIGLAFSAVQFAYRLMMRDRQSIRQEMVPQSILYLWVLLLLMAYAFYSYLAGFIIDYSREFLPPLAIIFAAWIYSSVPALKRDGILERFVMGGLCLSALLFFLHAYRKDFLGMGHHAALTVALVTLFTFAGRFRSSARRFTFCLIITGVAAYIAISERVPHLFPGVPSLAVIGIVYCLTWLLLREKDQPALRHYGRFVCLSLVLASFVVNISFSGTLLSPTYNAEWSPELVGKIASYVKAETEPADEVISGAVIWEFQALRRPFQMISHPFELEFATADRKVAIGRAVAMRPPKVIILDGWTERLYIRQIPSLTELLAKRYRLVPMAAGPAAFEVKVYRLKEEPVIGSNNL
jgi:4-amino-4-deoxy-L-arabinose transferase-like glycosyltransferase